MTKFSVKRPLTIVVAVILVIILGAVSFTEMQTDLLPSIDLPYAMIMTSFPGASPEEVEQTISKPMEQSMATLNNIKSISSVSNENVSMVILEFNDEVNMDSISVDIREKLDILKSQWDNDLIGSPSILKLNPNMLPVMVAAVDVEGMDNSEISDYVSTELLSKIESIEGVATVNAQGLLEEKINVVLNQDKIAAINKKISVMAADISGKITPEMISSILEAQNFSMPAGYLSEEGRDYLVRVGDKLSNQEEMENLVLFDSGIEGVGEISLSDAADVFVTDNASETYAKVNGNNAVIISMNKQTSYSTAEVSEAIKEKMNELMEDNPNLHTTYLMDQGMYIDVVVNSVLNNLMIGAVLAIIILLLFLRDIRPTFIIACSIPISVIFAFVLMYFSGVTLNIISLSGLAVGVGMLVDNSVVVIENIYRLRNKGVSRIKAAVTGATQVAGAIVASTLTTVCVFVPIVFVKGLTRQLFVDMGLTIGYSLLASLIVALTLVPAMSANLLKKVKPVKHGFMDHVLSVYEKMIRFCLRRRALVVLIAMALLIGSIFGALKQGTAYMPKMDGTQISVSVKMPEKATMEEAAGYMDTIMGKIQELSDVNTVGGMIGSSQLFGARGGSGSSSATLYVILKEDKKLTSEENALLINEISNTVPCEITANGSAMDMTALGGSGISLQVRGEDIETLKKTAAEVSDILSNVEGTTEVSDGIENPDEQIQITVNKNLAAGKGLTVAQVYTEISKKIGTKKAATTLRYDSVDYPVIVLEAKDESNQMTPSNIADYEITVTGMDGTNQTVKLSEIADIMIGDSLSSISRSGQQRYLNVTAAIKDGYNIGLVSQEVQKALKNYEAPKGFEIVSSGENDTINDAIYELTKMLLLAIVFIYLIMAAQFQSLLSPFIVMFTIPLAFTGGFLGLFLTGKEVSVIAMIGFVMLAGIIVNNGIVLVDYVNQLRYEGMEKKEALVEAGKTRMRPILMTALTTIFGLFSMAFGVGMGGDMVQPIAIVTIGGLLYATITTLFVIPVLYDLFHRRPMKKISEEELMLYQEIEK